MVWDVLQSSSGLILTLLTVFLLVAGLMKGVIGVGMPIVALPLLSMLIDVRAAVMLLSMPLILSNIPQAIEGGETVACFMRLIGASKSDNLRDPSAHHFRARLQNVSFREYVSI
jgi:hypothetical protein